MSWREGSKGALRSRFAAVRVRPAHGHDRKIGQQLKQRLLIEWPGSESAPAGCWFSNLPATTALRKLGAINKQRWLIERGEEELKQEVGLGHFEGRNWRGFHHHATLCISAYGFLVAESSRFPPLPRPVILDCARPGSLPASGGGARHARPQRHNPHSIATLRRQIARVIASRLPCCPWCGALGR